MALKQINPKEFILPAVVGVVKSAVANAVIDPIVSEDNIATSYLNTPVVDNLEFEGGTYTDLDGNPISYSGLTINTVTFEVTRPRNIVKTPISGRNGTVKEYVSDGDYMISARGFISSKDNVLPSEDIRLFKGIMSVPQQITVVCSFLNESFDVFNIVIEGWNISQVPGKRNSIPFTFTASSDVELGVNDLV